MNKKGFMVHGFKNRKTNQVRSKQSTWVLCVPVETSYLTVGRVHGRECRVIVF